MNICDRWAPRPLEFHIVPSYDAKAVDCQVTVSPEGVASSMGHIVDLQVTTSSFDVGEDDIITAEFDATSLKVVSEGPKPSDRTEIEKNAAKTLEANKYSKITFRSTSVQRDGDRARIEGDLTLHGVTKPISAQARNDGEHWKAEVTLDQRDFGIKPYSAMLGALKVKPQVQIKISVPEPGEA